MTTKMPPDRATLTHAYFHACGEMARMSQRAANLGADTAHMSVHEALWTAGVLEGELALLTARVLFLEAMIDNEAATRSGR